MVWGGCLHAFFQKMSFLSGTWLSLFYSPNLTFSDGIWFCKKVGVGVSKRRNNCKLRKGKGSRSFVLLSLFQFLMRRTKRFILMCWAVEQRKAFCKNEAQQSTLWLSKAVFRRWGEKAKAKCPLCHGPHCCLCWFSVCGPSTLDWKKWFQKLSTRLSSIWWPHFPRHFPGHFPVTCWSASQIVTILGLSAFLITGIGERKQVPLLTCWGCGWGVGELVPYMGQVYGQVQGSG